MVADSVEAVNNFFLEKGWSDGLPIIPPTKEAVEEMLAGTTRDPADVVTEVPPKWGVATVEKIAINAVMAGCLPGYLPLIITAVEAMCEESLNLFGVQNTTHPAGILLIVNGPIAKALNINSKSGAFGPGWRSNATIGRAIRLVQMNMGGPFRVRLICPHRVNLANILSVLRRTRRKILGNLCMWRGALTQRPVLSPWLPPKIPTILMNIVP